VQGTPNVNNLASIHMQKAVCAVRIEESTYEFDQPMPMATTSLHLHIYRVSREAWLKRQGEAP